MDESIWVPLVSAGLRSQKNETTKSVFVPEVRLEDTCLPRFGSATHWPSCSCHDCCTCLYLWACELLGGHGQPVQDTLDFKQVLTDVEAKDLVGGQDFVPLA